MVLYHANNKIDGTSKTCQICNFERMAISGEDSKQLNKRHDVQTTVYTTDGYSLNNILEFFYLIFFNMNTTTRTLNILTYLYGSRSELHSVNLAR